MMPTTTTTLRLPQNALPLVLRVVQEHRDVHSLSKLLMTMKMKVKSMMSMK
jgi:hypothetical protein